MQEPGASVHQFHVDVARESPVGAGTRDHPVQLVLRPRPRLARHWAASLRCGSDAVGSVITTGGPRAVEGDDRLVTLTLETSPGIDPLRSWSRPHGPVPRSTAPRTA